MGSWEEEVEFFCLLRLIVLQLHLHFYMADLISTDLPDLSSLCDLTSLLYIKAIYFYY